MELRIAGTASCRHLLESLGSDQWQRVSEGRSYDRAAPKFLDMAASDSQVQTYLKGVFANRHCHASSTDALWFDNAVVYGQGTVVTAEHQLVIDSAAEFINHGLAPDGSQRVDGVLTIPWVSSDRLAGTSLLVKRPWYRNFGHWLVDLMPLLALAWSARLVFDRIVFGDVRDANLLSMMQETAKHYFPGCPCIEASDEEPIRFERLLYMTPTHIPPLYKSPVAIDAVVAGCKEIFHADPAIRPPRIYISRRHCGQRKVSNEDDLEALLTDHGFATVYPERLGFADQIALFSNAKIVVGVKGAGLTNAVFCNAGTDVVLFSPAAFSDPFYWDLLAAREVGYSEIFCDCEDVASVAAADIRVDLKTVKQCLDVVALSSDRHTNLNRGFRWRQRTGF